MKVRFLRLLAVARNNEEWIEQWEYIAYRENWAKKCLTVPFKQN